MVLRRRNMPRRRCASDTLSAARTTAVARMAGGTVTTAFAAGRIVGWVFWSRHANNTTIEQAVRLNGVNSLVAFDRTDLICRALASAAGRMAKGEPACRLCAEGRDRWISGSFPPPLTADLIVSPASARLS